MRYGKVLLLGVSLFPVALAAAPGETFYVQYGGTTLLAQPGWRSESIGPLPAGTPLVELESQGAWIQVRVPGLGDRVGWVEHSQLGRASINTKQEFMTPPDDTNHRRFKGLFERFLESIQPEGADPYFLKTEDMGNGLLNVTVAQEWLKRPPLERKEHVAAIIQLWRVANSPGQPITVNMIDQTGVLHDFATVP